MFRSSLFGFTFALLFIAPLASAEVGLFDSRIWQRARAITPGQQIWSVKTSYQKISDRFSNIGASQALGRPYVRAVTWRQLLDSENTTAGRVQMQEYMTNNGAKENDVAATAAYDVSREEVGLHLNWAYGMMRRWKIGFDVPLIFRRTEARSRVDVMPLRAKAHGPGQSVSDIKQKVREISEQTLANSGYDQIPDQRASWDWGDVSLLNQVLVFQDYQWQWSLQHLLRFPTARNADLDEYIQLSDDSGQVDIGLTSMLDLRQGRWIFGTRLGFVAQLPDTIRARISSTSDVRQIDPTVSRDLGDWWWLSGDVEYKYSRRVDFSFEYAYLNKLKDTFKGGSSTGLNYASFSRNTDQEIHQTRVGLQYLIFAGGVRGGVEDKWIASLGYNYPWVGRNSLNASRATIDVITYF